MNRHFFRTIARTTLGFALLIPIMLVWSFGVAGATGVTGATGCTGPYRGCTYTGGSPTTTTIPAPSGPQCHYSIAADYSSFALKCTDLHSYFNYLYEITGGLCVGGLTCSNVMGINTGFYHNLTDGNGQNLATGGPSTVFYLDSSNALKCALTEPHSTCAAAGNSLIPGWTDLDTNPGCTSGATEINSFYWLFPPGAGSMGDLCVDAMHPSSAQTSSFIGFRGSSTSTSQTFVPVTTGTTMIYDGTNGYVTTPELGPCVINTFHGPKTIDSPQDAIYNAVMSPGSHTLLAVPASSPNFATIPPSWVNYSDVLGEAVSGFASSVAPVGTSTLDVDMSQAGNFSAIELFCSDSTGAWYDLGSISSIVASETAPTLPGSTTDCYSTLSWGWNPGTDLISAFKAIGCVVETLFVPTNFAYTSSLASGLSTKVPISYLSDAVAAVTTIASAVNTSTHTGSCSPLTISPFSTSSGHLATFSWFHIVAPVPGDLCGVSTPSYDLSAGELFGYRLWVRDFIAFAIWMTTVIFIWRMMPWSRKGDGIEILSTFGGLNNDGDYVESHQTNEGSD